MILYNVTIKVDASIAYEWLKWIQEIHIPEMMDTGCFIKSNLLRLLDVDDTEGPTYAVQYIAEQRADFDRYIDTYAEGMRQKSFGQWGTRFIAFRSVMQYVN